MRPPTPRRIPVAGTNSETNANEPLLAWRWRRQRCSKVCEKGPATRAPLRLATAGTATSAIETKTKELMALAIGIATHCLGCVAYHTKMAHQHGATRQEVLETVALAVYMGGGPAAVYGGDAVRAYDQFSGQRKAQ